MEKKLNEFEMALISGGGSASVNKEMIQKDPKGFEETTGIPADQAIERCGQNVVIEQQPKMPNSSPINVMTRIAPIMVK